MSDDPTTTIIEKYLGEQDPQIRMNALTAHAALGRKQNIDTIIRVALEDEDAAVRLHAEKELARRRTASTDIMTEIIIRKSLQEALQVEQQKKDVYLLAGRLRSRGFPMPGSGLPLTEKLRFIFSTRSQLSYIQDESSRLRALISSVLAGLLGALAAVIFAGLYRPLEVVQEEIFLLLLVGVLAAPAMTLVARRFVVPFPIQIDRPVAAVMEVLFAIGWGLLIGCLTYLLLLLLPDIEARLIEWLIMGTAVYIAAIRLGTLAGYSIFSNRRRRRITQRTLGSLLGLFALGFVFYLSLSFNKDVSAFVTYQNQSLRQIIGNEALASTLFSAQGDHAQLALVFLYLLFPIGFAMANGFARLDDAATPSGPAPDPAPHPSQNAGQTVNPVSVVEEFFRSTDPEMRLKALRGLVALKNERSIARVFNLALQDDDEQIQQHALEALARLDDAEMVALTQEALDAALTDKKQQKAAYLLAGQLRSQGFPVKKSGLSLARRIRRAFSMRSLLYPKRGWTFRIRSFEPGLLGALCGTILGAVFLLLTNLFFDQNNEVVVMPLLIFGVVVALVASLLAGQFAIPIHRHVDRPAGALIEFLRPVFWTLTLAIFLSIVIVNWIDRPGPEIILPLLGFPLLIPLIRGGTMAGYGAFTGLRANRIAQMTTGATTGLIVLTLSSMPISPGDPWDVFDIPYDWVDVFWLGLVPTCFAVANVYARIDGAEAPRGPLLGWLAKPLFYSFALVLALPFLLGLVNRVIPPKVAQNGAVTIAPDTSFTLRFTVPGEIPLHLNSSLTFDLDPVAGGIYDTLLRSTNTKTLHDLDQIHEEGDYTLRILPVETNTDFTVFPKLGERLSSGLGSVNRTALSNPRIRITSKGALTETMNLFQQLSDTTATEAIQNIIGKIAKASENSTVKAILDSTPPQIAAGDWNTLCWRGSLANLHADTLVKDACVKAVAYDTASVSYRHSRSVNRLLNLEHDLKNEDLNEIIADFGAFINAAKVDSAITRETRRWIDSLTQKINPLTPEVQEDLRQITFAQAGKDEDAVLTWMNYLLEQLGYTSEPNAYREVIDTLATATVQQALTSNPAFIPDNLWNTLCWRGSLVNLHADTLVVDACEKAVEYAQNERSLASYRHSRGVNKLLNWDTLDLDQEVVRLIPDLQQFITTHEGIVDSVFIAQSQRWVDSLIQANALIQSDSLLQGDSLRKINRRPANPLTPEDFDLLYAATFKRGGG